MKLRLVLFLSCILLFSSLSSLSLNAQQEGEVQLWLTKGAKPEFGPNVMVFDSSMPSQAIQKQIDAVYATQEHNEFGQQRNALLFLPGDYSVDVPVGFYTEVIGLGASPDATRIAGNVHADANHEHNNATTTFWRAAEGLSIKPAGGTMQWAVSQAVSLRRMHVRGDLVLHQNRGWASGGWMSDSLVDGNVDSGSQQQWISRNCDWKSWTGSNWNMVFVGVVHPPEGAWPSPPYTTVARTPVVREKPFLQVDAAGKFSVRVPELYSDSIGITFRGGETAGETIPITRFYIARPDVDTAETINAQLAKGKNLILTPGIYELATPIRVTRPHTVVLGLGFATLRPMKGTAAMTTADVDGIEIAGCSSMRGRASLRCCWRWVRREGGRVTRRTRSRCTMFSFVLEAREWAGPR